MRLLQCGFVRRFWRQAFALGLLVASSACTGGIASNAASEEDASNGQRPPDEDDAPPPPFVGDKPQECLDDGPEAPVMPLRRLSADEIVRSVEVALELPDLGEPLPVGVRAPEGFRNDVQVLLTSQQFVQGIDVWADKVAARASQRAVSVAACNSFGDACEKQFIVEVGLRLLRQPLSESQVSRFQKLFALAKAQGDDYSTGAALVLRALIASPQFLYRLEPASEDGRARNLSGYELATRLSFLAWGSGPDAELLNAAERGELDEADGISTQFFRLMQHERARKSLHTFVSEWLGLDLIPQITRALSLDEALRNDMAQETLRLFEHFLENKDAPVWELAVAPFTFTSGRLAKHSGVVESTSDALVKVDLSDEQPRLGFLTHAGFLMAHAGADIPKVVERGLTIFKTIMCQNPVPPGANVDTNLNQNPLGPGTTERMNADARAANATCGGCHKSFDPLAYAFERFDGAGRFVERDGNDNPLRTDGTMLWQGSFSDVEEERFYEGPRDFLKLLSEDVRFRSCVSQKVVQYAWGRGLDPEGQDMCPLYSIRARAARNGNSLYALFAAVVEDPQFRVLAAAP